jgi:hypothetical protein
MTRSMPARVIRGVLLLCTLSACGDDSASDGGQVGDAVVEPDASLATVTCSSLGSATSECRMARTILSCDLAGGGGTICLHDDPEVACEGAEGATCELVCEPHEYGVVCGGIGPAMSDEEPPAGCHLVFRPPGGTAYYCCPCSPSE